MFLEGIEFWKKIPGRAALSITDAENEAIHAKLLADIAVAGYMTEGHKKDGGRWEVKITSSRPWAVTNESGVEAVGDILTEAGFPEEG